MNPYYDDSPDKMFGRSRSLYNSPVDVILQGVPEKFDMDYDNIIRKASLMGMDTSDPELMGALFKKLARRIGKRIRARIRARMKKKGKFKYSASAPEGSVQFTEQGLSFVRPGPGMPGQPGPYGMQMKRSAGGGIMQQIQKNPLLLAIPAAALFLIMDATKKKPVEPSK